ncbi:BspA family leucine-rich repeat surface protein [Nonlabens sp. SCSIO 43208]|uniref:BspA family leucine-rich repeat surface protein n=1 Tax=Nonlabens sp. SCSIO 43208 TaxID=2793009 RepID=UPI003D6A3E8B
MKKLILLFSCLFIGFLSTAQTPDDFVFTVDMNSNFLYSLNITGTGSVNVDWGDGTSDTYTDPSNLNIAHVYSSSTIYTIIVSNSIESFKFNNDIPLEITQWGTSQWQTMNSAFQDCENLIISATDLPNLSQVNDMTNMFSGTSNFNSDISGWDVSNVTNMNSMFMNAFNFNSDLSNWNVSNVTDMSFMFDGASSFNSNISMWNVGNVTTMSNMFNMAGLFNSDISNWDVSNVTDMSEMFNAGASVNPISNFNSDISNWNVSNVTNMSNMFRSAVSFNSSLSNWDVSSVNDMSSMFSRASIFNADLSNWNVSNVVDMSGMFQGAELFNSDISNWDVSSVNDMSSMFSRASIFNADLSNWNVSNVTNMVAMFSQASNFNSNISNWNVSNVVDMSGMFFDTDFFNQDLSGWDVSNVIDMNAMFSDSIRFNSDISSWNVSNVTDMNSMFENASSFNQPLNNWDVSNVTDMNSMFLNAISFNQPLGSWDISNVNEMLAMFSGASSFNQDLSFWNFTGSGFFYLGAAFNNSGLSVENYDRLLSRLVNLNLMNTNLGAQGLEYCDSFSRNILLQRGFTITNDTLSSNCADNVLFGKITFDFDNNGCDPNDLIASNTGLSISNGNAILYLYTDATGNYSITLPDDTYTVTPIIDTNLYTATPANATFTAANQNTTTQDFCLTATTPTNDLEITILPLEEGRPGFDTNYKLVYKNKGNTQLSGNIAFTYDDDFMDFVNANPAVATSSVGNLNWSFSNLDPFETREIDFTINMNTPTDPSFPLNSNDILNFTASITPSVNDATPMDNVFDLDQTVVNSYDPNDKTCLQGDTIEPGMVGEYVHYRIRFENEGTASAINVRIVDYIDTSVFDISTFTPLSGSHDYVAQITEGNKVEFIFDNINLPNTAPASQGYVLFKIKTVSSLVLGDTFSNQAGIYFDFNFPIITNLETTTVAMPLSNSDVTTMTMSLYPNPAHDSVTMTSNVQFDSYSIYDLRGVLISSYTMYQSDYQDQIDVSSLASGMYMIQVNSEHGSVTQRLIVN